jgi:hypothetical protein
MKWNTRNTPSPAKWRAQSARFDSCNGTFRLDERGRIVGRRDLSTRPAARIVHVVVDGYGRIVR